MGGYKGEVGEGRKEDWGGWEKGMGGLREVRGKGMGIWGSAGKGWGDLGEVWGKGMGVYGQLGVKERGGTEGRSGMWRKGR